MDFFYLFVTQGQQPVEFNHAINYVNKIKVKRSHFFFEDSASNCFSLLTRDIFVSFAIEPVSRTARHLQGFFGNSPHISKGAEKHQRGKVAVR